MAAATDRRWRHVQVGDDEVQVYPLNDLVDHDLHEDACTCGPRVECIPREDQADAWMYVHSSLDGREQSE